ncbi:MAG TPA: acyltransferase [Alloacidobacterium sp.]|nr:acyltransferase [Alloacidobacterium sp.]
MAKSSAKFSVHLDAMRVVAALTVFLMHIKGLFIGPTLTQHMAASANSYEHNELFTSPAHEAVIVFFVLSGFFVGGGVLRGWQKRIWTWKTYAIQRLTRLWIVLIPALLLTLALDTAGLHLFGLSGPYGHPHWESTLTLEIPNNLNAHTFFGCLFFLQKILVQPLGSNGALWTLAYEFWFYVAFPLGMGALTSRFSWPIRVLNAALLIGVGFFVGQTITAYFLLWLIGASLQAIPKKLSPGQVRILAPAGVVLLCAVSVALWALKWDMYLSDLIEACTCAALCYVILHETDEAPHGSAYVSTSRLLSDMSYTLYLAHLPIVLFLCALLASRGILRGFDARHLVIAAGVSVIAFACCYLLYLCFERHSDRVRGVLLSKFGSARKEQPRATEVLS